MVCIQLILGQIIHNTCGASDIQTTQCALLLAAVILNVGPPIDIFSIDQRPSLGKEKFDR